MLRSLIPQFLESIMIDLARLDQNGNHWLIFVSLLGIYMLLFGFVLRAILLRLDAFLALRARLAGAIPGLHVFAMGYVAVWVPPILGVAASIMVGAEAVISIERAGIAAMSAEVIGWAEDWATRYWR